MQVISGIPQSSSLMQVISGTSTPQQFPVRIIRKGSVRSRMLCFRQGPARRLAASRFNSPSFFFIWKGLHWRQKFLPCSVEPHVSMQICAFFMQNWRSAELHRTQADIQRTTWDVETGRIRPGKCALPRNSKLQAYPPIFRLAA